MHKNIYDCHYHANTHADHYCSADNYTDLPKYLTLLPAAEYEAMVDSLPS